MDRQTVTRHTYHNTSPGDEVEMQQNCENIHSSICRRATITSNGSAYATGPLSSLSAILVHCKVWPMYTSDIENWQHRSLLEHWRIGVGKSPMSMLSKIVVLLRSPNFHRHRGGWLPRNLTVFLAVFLGAVS